MTAMFDLPWYWWLIAFVFAAVYAVYLVYVYDPVECEARRRLALRNEQRAREAFERAVNARLEELDDNAELFD